MVRESIIDLKITNGLGKDRGFSRAKIHASNHDNIENEF